MGKSLSLSVSQLPFLCSRLVGQIFRNLLPISEFLIMHGPGVLIMNEKQDACLLGAWVSVGETGSQKVGKKGKVMTNCDKCSKEDSLGSHVMEGVSL